MKGGNVWLNDFSVGLPVIIDIDQYCLEKSASTGAFDWNLYVCEKHSEVARTISVISKVLLRCFDHIYST